MFRHNTRANETSVLHRAGDANARGEGEENGKMSTVMVEYLTGR